MIARLPAKQLKAASEFIAAGIGSDLSSAWLRISADRDNGLVSFKVEGLASYQTQLPAKVLKSGVALVNSKVFAELVGKIKNKYLLQDLTVATFDDRSLTITNGADDGFKYDLLLSPTVIQGEFDFQTLARIVVPASCLMEVAGNMKAIKEAESDLDMPSCEFKLEGKVIQFAGVTRLRSVVSRMPLDSFPADFFLVHHVATEHLVKMEKGLKSFGLANVEVGFHGQSVSFCYRDEDSERIDRIRVRTLIREQTKIQQLIEISKRPEYTRARFDLDGDLLKQAYDRLDAFGKRNETSAHKINFVLDPVRSELCMSAVGQGVGRGSEVIPVVELHDLPGPELVKFAASGSKLADMLRLSKFKRVHMQVGQRNILIHWGDEKLSHLAILAGMQVGE